MDCTLGHSGQTKRKPVGRCRGWCSPGQTHQEGFQDLAKQRQGCPDIVLWVVLLQGESWIESPSFKPRFSYLSVFPYWKGQVFWGAQMFLNTVPSNLNQLLPGILVNLNNQTSNTGPALWFYIGNNLTADFSSFLPQSCWIQEEQLYKWLLEEPNLIPFSRHDQLLHQDPVGDMAHGAWQRYPAWL